MSDNLKNAAQLLLDDPDACNKMGQTVHEYMSDPGWSHGLTESERSFSLAIIGLVAMAGPQGDPK